MSPEGLLLVNKSIGCSSFRIVSILRKHLNVKKIGHAGTLDPFATGLMIMLIGRNYTKKSNQFMDGEKEYDALLFLGKTSTTYDPEGELTNISDIVPSLLEIQKALEKYQGHILQIPPMHCAKKIAGQRLYKLARKGIEIERQPSEVYVETTLIKYEHPFVRLHIKCSKGTYIRSLAHDIGQDLGCGAYLTELTRTRIGQYLLKDAVDQKDIGILSLSDHLIL